MSCLQAGGLVRKPPYSTRFSVSLNLKKKGRLVLSTNLGKDTDQTNYELLF